MVSSLSSAARTAVANGAPDSAIAYPRRALAEPPSGRLRPGVLLQLGFAESYTADPQAAARLGAALAAAAEATAQVAITLALGRMLQIDGRNQETLEVFDRARARMAGTDRRAALTLEGAALGAAQLDASTADDAARRIARVRRGHARPGLPRPPRAGDRPARPAWQKADGAASSCCARRSTSSTARKRGWSTPAP